MFDLNYFALRLFRLKSPEEWSSPKEGLCFVFPTGGAGQYVNGSAIRRLVPGDVLIWEGDAGGKLCVAKGAEMIFRSFLLRLEHLLPLFGGDEISLLREITSHFKGSRFFPADSALAIKCHRLVEEVPARFDLEHRSHLLHVAGTILSEEFKVAHHERIGLGQVEERIIQVFEKLSVEQLLNLSVEELAAKFGCSRRHLNRLFHQYFGLSVGALRMEMRLQKAVSLLRDVSAKVINVAQECGFNHLGLFNTCFKRRFGLSPGRWRKQSAQSKIRLAAVPANDVACPLVAKGLCPLAGRAENSAPLLPSVAPRAKSLSLGAKASPDMRAGEQVLQHPAPLIYPKTGQSLPLTA